MISAVRKGNYADVVKRLDAYNLNLGQRTELKQTFDGIKNELEAGATANK